MKKQIKPLKILFIAIFINCMPIYSQTYDAKQILKIKVAIKNFFISKGEIDKQHQLDIKAIHIIDSTDIGNYKKGIYIIRTVYRTDGNDYLLYLKDNLDYEIVDFKDLKLIMSKAINLYGGSTDGELFNYLKSLLNWYEKDYFHSRPKRYTTKK